MGDEASAGPAHLVEDARQLGADQLGKRLPVGLGLRRRDARQRYPLVQLGQRDDPLRHIHTLLRQSQGQRPRILA